MNNSPGAVPKLGVMMFMQFFVWGAWYVSMTGFIKAQGMDALTGAAYTVAPIAAIVSPFFLAMIADRFFSGERVLGVLHLLGGAFLIAAPYCAQPFELAPPPADASIFYKVALHDLAAYKEPFILCLLGHTLCYMPTLGLSASVAFHHLTNREKQFPMIRVLGTIGWIGGNWVLLVLAARDQSAGQFYIAGGAGIALGLFSFLLPHTPAPSKGKKVTLGQVIGADSLKMLKRPEYFIFIVCSFLICIPLAGYYQQGRNFVEAMGVTIGGSTTAAMSLGQMAEVFFMLVMPWCFVRLGAKWMLAVGILAWVVRYGLFTSAADEHVKWMVLGGVLLHGICYDFFFVTGMIYADKKAETAIRHQAQGFLVLITQGVGMLIGAKVIAAIVVSQTDPVAGAVNWKNVWFYPCVFAGAVLLLFVLLFRDRAVNGSKQAASA